MGNASRYEKVVLQKSFIFWVFQSFRAYMPKLNARVH